MNNRFYSLIIVMSLLLLTHCKSNDHLVHSKDGKLKIEKSTVIRDLSSIIDQTSELSMEEQESLLNVIKNRQFEDKEIDELIVKATEQINNITAEASEDHQIIKPVFAEKKNPKLGTIEKKLNFQFQSLASDEMANSTEEIIAETLTYFESHEVPVLILLKGETGKQMYDRPTTIEHYLYYLVDLRKNDHIIKLVALGKDDKINKLILTRK